MRLRSSLTGPGNGTIDVAAGVTFNVPGLVSNNGASISSLTKTGAGTLILPNGDNSFSGGFYLNQGVVVANPLIDNQQNLGIGTNAITFTGSATLQMSATPDNTESGGYLNNMVINSGVTATLDLNTGNRRGINTNIYLEAMSAGLAAVTIMSSSGRRRMPTTSCCTHRPSFIRKAAQLVIYRSQHDPITPTFVLRLEQQQRHASYQHRAEPQERVESGRDAVHRYQRHARRSRRDPDVGHADQFDPRHQFANLGRTESGISLDATAGEPNLSQ